MCGFHTYNIWSSRERLPQLDRCWTYRAKCPCIIGYIRLDRAETGNPAQSFDLRRRIPIRFYGAQGTMTRQNAAPF